MNTLIRRILVLSLVVVLAGFTVYAFNSSTKDRSFDTPDKGEIFPEPNVVNILIKKVNFPSLTSVNVSAGGLSDLGKGYKAERISPGHWQLNLPVDFSEDGNGVLSVIAYNSRAGFTKKKIDIRKHKSEYSVSLRLVYRDIKTDDRF